MHVLFENNIDEIPQVIQLSKKNKNSVFFEFKHTKNIFVSRFNNQVCDLNTCVNAGLHMQLLSKEGYLIEGYSNRLYLSDVMSRLYQSLENILKTNKGHKVASKIEASALKVLNPTKSTDKSVESYTLESLNLPAFLEEVYSSLSDQIKKSKNIYLEISALNEHYLSGNSKGEKSTTEETTFKFNGEIYNKNSPSKIKKFTKKLSLKDFKSKESYISKFNLELGKYLKELNA